MNTEETENKINQDKRPIKSFEADKDVADMLETAKQDGLKIGEICNRALKKHGLAIIREIVAEHRQRQRKWETIEKDAATAEASSQSYRAIRLAPESGRKQTTESPSESKPSRASSARGNRR